MSFRYKIALLSLASLAVIYGWYFLTLAPDQPVGLQTADTQRLIGTIVAVTVVQIVGASIIALTTKDRWSMMDEREAGFDRGATYVGYYVVIAGVLLAAATRTEAGAMAHAVLFAVVVAECVRQATFLIAHHRGA